MGIKIAIIDDKASNRNILKDKLLKHGHFEITLVAEDVKFFFQKMKVLPVEKMPDVALMDLEMPNMDGVNANCGGVFFFSFSKICGTYDIRR
ncbi:MAG: response regulator [Ferruginibacter sp.]